MEDYARVLNGGSGIYRFNGAANISGRDKGRLHFADEVRYFNNQRFMQTAAPTVTQFTNDNIQARVVSMHERCTTFIQEATLNEG